ncbi:hypothetical protein I3843_08G016900 [Carya illinoinensis]|nr:hypothetical protein I3843_08G016900 [Carya illinoinensis]
MGGGVRKIRTQVGWVEKIIFIQGGGGGRLTLIKSTLSNLPTYFLSLFPLLASIASKIEKLQRDFLWSGIGDEFKFHLVGWDKVCTPLRVAGLGVHNVRLFNQALLGKWLWHYNYEKETLWRGVIDAKYGSARGGWYSNEGRGAYGVGLWKHIRKGWGVFARNTRLCMGNGQRISFWNDVWVGDTALKAAYPAIFSIAREKYAKVANLWGTTHDAQAWNINLTREAHDWEVTMLVEFFNLLHNISPDASTEDKLVWCPSRKGKFLVGSYYKTITASPLPNFPWKSVWRNKAPPKAAFFVWTAALGKILTIDNLRRHGLIMMDWCCMRKKSGETVDHLLLHCEFARDTWNYFFSRMGLAWTMPVRVSELLASWRGISGTTQIVAIWKMVPICILWCIWSERNNRHFEDRERSVEEFRGFLWKTLFLWAMALEFNGLSFHDFLVTFSTS